MHVEEIIEMKIMKKIEVALEKDSIQKILEGMTETVVVDLDKVQELVLIDRIRCYKCREYDHFAKDCLTSK